MKKQLSNEQLKKLYTVDDSHKWMKVISDREYNNSHFKTYKNQKNRLLRLVKYIKFSKDDEIVDFACGNGLWADVVSKKVRTYTGVDFSKPFIKLAGYRGKIRGSSNLKFYCEDIANFSQDNLGKFDKAFALDFTEHIYDKEFLRLFTAIKNTVRDGGKLYIHTPNGDYFLELMKKSNIFLKQSKGHIGIRNDKELTKLLSGVGFKSTKISHLPHYLKPFTAFHFIGLTPVIGKFFKARLWIECVK